MYQRQLVTPAGFRLLVTSGWPTEVDDCKDIREVNFGKGNQLVFLQPIPPKRIVNRANS